MMIKTFFRKLFSPIIWGNLLAMLIVAMGLLYGVKLWLDDYTHHGQTVEVPSVTGKTPLEARNTLQMYGLRAEVADSSYDSALPPGIILSQRPTQGSQVKEGREILLTINSRTAPTMIVPEIAGNCSVREAQMRLEELNFKLGPIEYVEGDAGWVYGMKCNGKEVMNGDKLPIGATIVLMVGGKLPVDTLDDEEGTVTPMEGNIYNYD